MRIQSRQRIMADIRSKENPYYKLGEFEGPLDLLLFLIKKNEVNIYDIPISEITEQYLEYLNYATRVDLDNITEFYIMAATLLYIKSHMLLPVDVDYDEEIEDPRSELVDQLIEYQKYKKLGKLMADKEPDWLLERRRGQPVLPFEQDSSLWEEVAVWDLLKLFSSMVSSISIERIVDIYEEVTIKEKIILIYEYLEEGNEFVFTNLIRNDKSILEVICAFLAVLELVKQKAILVYQNKLFGDIRIMKTEHGKTDG
jgi:segregation and condensation protein A